MLCDCDCCWYVTNNSIGHIPCSVTNVVHIARSTVSIAPGFDIASDKVAEIMDTSEGTPFKVASAIFPPILKIVCQIVIRTTASGLALQISYYLI